MNNNSNHHLKQPRFSLNFSPFFSRMPNTPPGCRAPGMNTLLPIPIDNPTTIINIPTSISISSPPLLNPRFFYLLFSRFFFSSLSLSLSLFCHLLISIPISRITTKFWRSTTMLPTMTFVPITYDLLWFVLLL